jgi:hypothetical protein
MKVIASEARQSEARAFKSLLNFRPAVRCIFCSLRFTKDAASIGAINDVSVFNRQTKAVNSY